MMKKLRVAISGASGLVGSALTAFLGGAGHEVFPLVRQVGSSPREIAWDPESEFIEREKLEGVDALVHLAGANIAARWTRKRRAAILRSRVSGTRLIAGTLAALASKPATFVCASAIGYYGPCDNRPVDESSGPGRGFLADVTRAWEDATLAAAAAGIRTVRARFGVILAAEGGALAKMLPAFRLGLGGPIGGGRQGFSWVALVDVVRAIDHVMSDPAIAGPVNVVAPSPVSQRAFARALGHVLHRPAIVPLPALAVTAAFGAMGRETLLGGAYVVPEVLRRTGFVWEAPRVDDALRLALGTP
jgi:uncharacterized protein (TIGR01777 family)